MGDFESHAYIRAEKRGSIEGPAVRMRQVDRVLRNAMGKPTAALPPNFSAVGLHSIPFRILRPSSHVGREAHVSRLRWKAASRRSLMGSRRRRLPSPHSLRSWADNAFNVTRHRAVVDGVSAFLSGPVSLVARCFGLDARSSPRAGFVSSK